MPDFKTILGTSNTTMNKLALTDSAAHDWYRFVLSYPPHLVRHYLGQFGVSASSRVLDPFCGTGTTLVECKKQGIPSVGVEAHPMTCFASAVKTDWTPDPDALLAHAHHVAAVANAKLARQDIDDAVLADANGRHDYQTLPQESFQLLLANSISPRPLHKVLVLLDALGQLADPRFAGHERLALAKALVFAISNLHFGPEVGVGPAKSDADVITPWLANVATIAADIRQLQADGLSTVPAEAINADARNLVDVLAPNSIDAIICSPPYPNEKDYTRTTRLESVLLGFITTKDELRSVKRGLVRSNTRTVYKATMTIAGSPGILRSNASPVRSRSAGSSSARHPGSSASITRWPSSTSAGWPNTWRTCGPSCGQEPSLPTWSGTRRPTCA